MSLDLFGPNWRSKGSSRFFRSEGIVLFYVSHSEFMVSLGPILYLWGPQMISKITRHVELPVPQLEVPSTTAQFLPGAPKWKIRVTLRGSLHSGSASSGAVALVGMTMTFQPRGLRQPPSRGCTPQVLFLAVSGLQSVFPALWVWTPVHLASPLAKTEAPWCCAE